MILLLYASEYEKNVELFLQQNMTVEIEAVGIEHDDINEDIIEYLSKSNCKYCYIYNPDYVYAVDILQYLEESLEKNPENKIAVTAHRFADDHFQLIAPPYRVLGQGLFGGTFYGNYIVEMYEKTRVNIVGGVGCCLFRKELFLDISGKDLRVLIQGGEKEKDILYDLFRECRMCFTNLILAARIGKTAQLNQLKSAYDSWSFTKKRQTCKYLRNNEITFFCTDRGEYYNVLPIALEAEKRGYIVSFSNEMDQKAVIGIYCQHVCNPENSDFSVVLLHDMLQDYSHWPNLWELEPWNGFDIGILPGEDWEKRWKKCGALYYANPRYGVYTLGYPKCDVLVTDEHKNRVQKVLNQLGFKYEYTVLYAPSWENDGKEDDFIRALADLPVNLLIKQAHWPPAYSHIIQNIHDMRMLHEGKYENVYYLEPEEDIMVALDICDLVVSEESNVLLEATLFGKLGIAIDDWTVPDTKPPRAPHFPEEYAVHCMKSDLHEIVDKCLRGDIEGEIFIERGQSLFGKRGNVCSQIMDAIDYYTGNGNNTEFLNYKLIPELKPFD